MYDLEVMSCRVAMLVAEDIMSSRKLHIKTLMEDEKSSRRKQERDKIRYAEKAKSWLPKVVRSGSKARALVDDVVKEFPGRSSSVKTQRKNRWVKLAKSVPSIIEFTEYIGGPKRMYGAALYIVRDVVLGDLKIGDAKDKAEKMALKWYMEKNIQQEGSVFEKGGYEDEFLKFFPPNVSFKLGPTRKVKSIVETFGREMKSWETMARKITFIAEKFNDIVREVKKDMGSSDEVIHLCALMTAITIETGLRPGEVGNMANIKDPDSGENVEIETFGITTLQKRHINFIRDSFIEVRFIGKKGTENIAHLSDSDIVKGLQGVLDKTTVDGDTSMLFVSKDGSHVGYKEMSKYVSDKWGDITPTDFRKLKATKTFYEKLKKRSEEMHDEVAQIVAGGKKSIKEAVVAKIIETLTEAAEDAQKALSHLNWKTTIKTYVDPRVVVNFLNQGGLDDTLDDILIRGKNVVLTFDIDAFMKNAGHKVAKPVVIMDEVGESSESILDVMNSFGNLVDMVSG